MPCSELLFSPHLDRLGVVTATFVILIIWKSMTGVPEDNFVILDAAQRRLVSQQQAIVARAERLTRLAKYCGFSSLGLLLLSGGVWVYCGIVAVNGAGRRKGVRKSDWNVLVVAMGRGAW